MKLITNTKHERALREILQQFEPEGGQEGAEDGLVLKADQTEQGISLQIEDQEGKVRLSSETPLEDESGYLSEDQIVKRAGYDLLSQWHEKELPWGILTGVKPVRFYQKIHQTYPNEDTETILTDIFRLSKEDAAFAGKIYELQAPMIDHPQKKSMSLYVGIPVCPQRCTYCSFVSSILDPKRELVKDYLPRLEEEIKRTGELFEKEGFQVDSVYIGGGTPSVLLPGETDRLINSLRDSFDLSSIREFTFEAGRPDTTTKELLDVLAAQQISRLCLNPQSMNADTLRAINRLYDPQRVYDVYEMIRKAGDFDVNMDLILGLADEGEEAFMRSLEAVMAMRPENLTVHNLSVKKGTRVKESQGTRVISRFHDDFFGKIRSRLSDVGYEPYYLYRQKYTVGNGENTGYTLPGKESFYNIMMMGEKQTILGIGAGSSGKLYHPDTDLFSRVYTVKDLRTYNNRTDEILEKKFKAYRDYLDDELFLKDRA